jgi:hypothetical protein
MSHRYQPPIEKDDEPEEAEEDSFEELEAEKEEFPEEVTPVEAEEKGFLDDPWPVLVFVLMIVGFIMVLFTPIELWTIYRWSFFATYIFVVVFSIGSTFGFKIWRKNPEAGLRWGGLFNGVTIAFCGVLGVIDSLLTILTGDGVLPGSPIPVFAVTIFVVVMCMYSVVLIDRTLKRGY